MHRLKVIGLALAAIFIISIVATASASAAELPQFNEKTGFTASFGKSKLNMSGAEITSTKGTASGSATSTRLGPLDIMFEGAKLGGKECHSLGDTKELILVTGEWHLVLHQGIPLILFLVNQTHIECAFLGILVLIAPSHVLGKIDNKFKEDTTTFTVLVLVVEGKQEATEYENNSGELIKTGLKGKIGEKGAELLITQEDLPITVTTEKLVELLEK